MAELHHAVELLLALPSGSRREVVLKAARDAVAPRKDDIG